MYRSLTRLLGSSYHPSFFLAAMPYSQKILRGTLSETVCVCVREREREREREISLATVQNSSSVVLCYSVRRVSANLQQMVIPLNAEYSCYIPWVVCIAHCAPKLQCNLISLIGNGICMRYMLACNVYILNFSTRNILVKVLMLDIKWKLDFHWLRIHA